MLEGMVAAADILQRANVSSDETYDVFKKVSEPTDQASKPRAKMTQKASLMWGILALVGVLPAFAAFFGAFNWLLVSFAVVAAIVSATVTWVT